ncbi:MAG TPA: efflux RND transporter periplasmic adaptor subunit [Gemmatimonadales bacterium]|nr:efflux RND transporter periplasmic adaptor subunit [Gemmatimonadales bacterium]
MDRRQITLVAGLGGAALIAAVVYGARRHSAALVLSGVVTTNDVIVSPVVEGRLSQLLVHEGDSVSANELLAVLAPGELAADRTYFAQSAAGLSERVQAAEADLVAAVAQDSEAQANLANAQTMLARDSVLFRQSILPTQGFEAAQTAYAVAKARIDAASTEVAAKRSALVAVGDEQAAAAAQTTRADVRLGYTEIRSPISGIVDVLAARAGEVLSPGQAILTLVDPDDLWVRTDIEETYIGRIRRGDTLTVRLPDGEERTGTVFYRGVDADFATQRDVSRTKRDIKTFEIRLRVNNADRRLALGMTASVLLPPLRHGS